jgi:hypothetical protein
MTPLISDLVLVLSAVAFLFLSQSTISDFFEFVKGALFKTAERQLALSITYVDPILGN